MPIKNCKISTTGNFCFHLIPVDDKHKFSLLTRDYGTPSCCSKSLNMYFEKNLFKAFICITENNNDSMLPT